jgi:hypothetical protein
MSQNTSHAVMAQRKEARDSLDDFPTPAWATRALIEHVILPSLDPSDHRSSLSNSTAWEPAANRGYMSRTLREYFKIVHTSDAHDYSTEPCAEIQDTVSDFLFEGTEPACLRAHGANWIITNPPFRLAEQFIARSFRVKNWRGTAMLVRTSFLEGVGRYANLFKTTPPSIVAQFAERVPMFRGRLDPNGSTATSYCWLAWMEGAKCTRLMWIPPCRRQLERAGDYPAEAAA